MSSNHGLAQALATQAIFGGTTTTATHPSTAAGTASIYFPPPNPPPVFLPAPQNKAPEQFALWLLGASDLVPENTAPSAEQWDMIKKRLYVVIGTLAADRLLLGAAE